MVADLAKVVTQKIFRSQAKIQKACKLAETTPPTWVRVLDVPSNLAEKAADGLEAGLAVSFLH